METLINLIRIIELTRSQPQCGYALAGIAQDDLSNLAEHHYLVTFIAWQLALNLNAAGAKLDVLKVLEFCLVHDLGELFGGDISMPYATANPTARGLAKAFESENQRFFSKFFGTQKEHFAKLGSEILGDDQTDESIVAKLADYLETTHYKIHVRHFVDTDVKLVVPKMLEKISRMKDAVAKTELTNFVGSWSKEIGYKDIKEVLYSSKD